MNPLGRSSGLARIVGVTGLSLLSTSGQSAGITAGGRGEKRQ